MIASSGLSHSYVASAASNCDWQTAELSVGPALLAMRSGRLWPAKVCALAKFRHHGAVLVHGLLESDRGGAVLAVSVEVIDAPELIVAR